MQLAHVPATLDETQGQVIEQLRMRWSLTPDSKVARRGH